MVDTVTANYGWTKPSVGGDQATWGGLLNGDLDLIDAQVFSNQKAITNGATMVGQVTMFAGTTPPTNWLWCNGAVYNNSAIPALAPILANRFPGGNGTTTTAVPNLWSGRSAVGYDGSSWLMGASGGEQNHTLVTGEMPVHNHAISDPGHNHTFSDPGHNHSINQSPHGHGVSDPGHVHGGVATGLGAGPNMAAASGWQLNMGNTASAGTGIGVQAANANVSLNASGTGASIAAAATGISAGNAGSGGAHNNMPPYTVIGFIIRYQ